jgi:NADPH-dependent 2,4-dienoyl-CoA reductase/sulfur reductase-like enzyme/rhodanese-related sulfurtransferase
MTNRLVIIGGVAGGATAAARARRLDEFTEIILFERGDHISFANCGLPYHIGGIIENRDDLLLMTPEDFTARYNVDVRTGAEIITIDKTAKTVTVKDRETGQSYQEVYDKLILAPGAEPINPPIPGIESNKVTRLRNLPDMDRIKDYVDRHSPKSAVVVGAGFIGLEMAENLAHRNIDVTIIEKLDQVLPPLDLEMAAFIQLHLKEKGVTCILEDGVASFSDTETGLLIQTESGAEIACNLAVMSVGVKPERQLAEKAGLAIGDTGGIRVDQAMRTSDPHIFAVGDAAEITDLVTGQPALIPLAGPANKQGRVAADNALGRQSVFKGALGTAIVKVFDLTAASTGAAEKKLKAHGIPYLASYTHSASHAGYYPNAGYLAIKILFSPDTGKLLGAQAVGSAGVDKRIDVLATAIRGSMTVHDLEELELAYAPPFSSAKDPVNMAGFVAANILKGDLEKIDWPELNNLDPARDVIVDLRHKIELDELGEIPGAVHIPVDSLRGRINSLDKDKRYVLACAVGIRAYIAYRIFVQHGFKACIMAGGFETYAAVSNRVAIPL